MFLLSGLGLGIYWGFWCLCVGGIADVLNAIKSTPVDTMGVCIGLIKFFISGYVGWGTFWVGLGLASAAE
jgi:hypothetical protein